MSMSFCMCKPMETAQSLWRWHTCGGNTAKVGMISTDSTLGVVPYVGGLQACPIDKCSKQGRGLTLT